jgi:hypothetical protein
MIDFNEALANPTGASFENPNSGLSDCPKTSKAIVAKAPAVITVAIVRRVKGMNSIHFVYAYGTEIASLLGVVMSAHVYLI